MWDLVKSEWTKLCPKASNPTIKIYADEQDKMTVAVRDADSSKLNHAIPQADKAKFKVKETRLSCQWMTDQDCIQNQETTINILFKTKQAFDSFLDVFERSLHQSITPMLPPPTPDPLLSAYACYTKILIELNLMSIVNY